MSDFTDLPDLASEAFGGAAILCNDEFFAAKENLLKPGRASFIPDKYTDARQVDGRLGDAATPHAPPATTGAWSVLGMPGRIYGVDVDTHHFVGNFPADRVDLTPAPRSTTARS